MPRRRRGLKSHACYHITHRCHKREFLFKFARDRETYLQLLQEMNRRFKLDILNYVITSNHIHLLVWVRRSDVLPQAMQFLQGEMGQHYNKRKNREGAFWKDRYHSTLIQTGEHLSRCIFYIDMNMIRAGVVEHPSEWRHGGFHELAGLRQRYRVINQKRLLQCLGTDSNPDDFQSWYLRTLDKMIVESYHVRQPWWSESFAVGDSQWLSAIYNEFNFKRKKIRKSDSHSDMVLEEAETYYIEG